VNFARLCHEGNREGVREGFGCAFEVSQEFRECKGSVELDPDDLVGFRGVNSGYWGVGAVDRNMMGLDVGGEESAIK
jgi:hypothetical protein